MTDMGTPKRIIRVREPHIADPIERPIRATPITVPERETVPVKR